MRRRLEKFISDLAEMQGFEQEVEGIAIDALVLKKGAEATWCPAAAKRMITLQDVVGIGFGSKTGRGWLALSPAKSRPAKSLPAKSKVKAKATRGR